MGEYKNVFGTRIEALFCALRNKLGLLKEDKQDGVPLTKIGKIAVKAQLKRQEEKKLKFDLMIQKITKEL